MRLRKAFANVLSANIELPKSKISKMIQLSGATFDFMDPLGLMHPKRKTTKKLSLYQKTVKTIL